MSAAPGGNLDARLERSGGRALRLLGGGGREGALAAHESQGARSGAPDARDRAAIAASLLKHWQARPQEALAGRDRAHEADFIAAELIDTANAALDLLRADGPRAALAQSQAMALESVLMVRGRPALRVQGAAIEPIDDDRHPGSGVWRTLLNDHEKALARRAAAVAGVMYKDNYSADPELVVGTAWLVAPDLAITNRHVLLPDASLRLARRRPGTPTQARLKSDVSVCLDFAYDNGPARSLRYRIDDIVFVAEDNDPIDVAVLRVRPQDPNAPGLPAPLRVARQDEWDSDRVCVVGHPGRMAQVPADTAAVFGDPDGRKRVSFGELMDPDDAKPHDLIYDSSTIGGYSGGTVSPVGAGGADDGVIGLHYRGGDIATGNRAILASALRAHAVQAWLP
ncbi:hypothetical protein ABIE09_003738 [Lysobacter enzymogenes]|uniref:trypsin-like serine peptidase n=1 Tax=Lysobacter enzymogenes TaxID=69 RepID=UPI00339ABB22